MKLNFGDDNFATKILSYLILFFYNIILYKYTIKLYKIIVKIENKFNNS